MSAEPHAHRATELPVGPAFCWARLSHPVKEVRAMDTIGSATTQDGGMLEGATYT
jgi:hypothetical protein